MAALTKYTTKPDSARLVSTVNLGNGAKALSCVASCMHLSMLLA